MHSPNNLTDPELLALADRILADSGFDIRQYKERPLKRRLAVRMRSCQVKSYEEYRQRLKDDPGEYAKLLDTLTINVTKFYRNAETYQAVQEKVLPAILEQGGPRAAQIWSAGCSSGEEPYSLAILWREFCQARGMEAECRIQATDIDLHILDKARAGSYPRSSMDELPHRLTAKYFAVENERYLVSPGIKEMVSFARLDLFAPYPFTQLDLIFCRNVLIYFSRQTQEDIFYKFARALRPGGFLVLGKVENMFGQMKDTFASFDVKERIYRVVK
jgi:chemotaxis protein methyltransferase CheR